MNPLKMYSLLKMVIFHCYVSLPECMEPDINSFYMLEKIDSAKPLQGGEYKLMSQLNWLRYVKNMLQGIRVLRGLEYLVVPTGLKCPLLSCICLSWFRFHYQTTPGQCAKQQQKHTVRNQGGWCMDSNLEKKH